jgi:hypothetical protein
MYLFKAFELDLIDKSTMNINFTLICSKMQTFLYQVLVMDDLCDTLLIPFLKFDIDILLYMSWKLKFHY